MAQTSFLGDMLTTLFERRRGGPGVNDARSIEAMCGALLSSEGEVSGLRLAKAILTRYAALDTDGKRAFFTFLNDELELSPKRIAELSTAYADDPSVENYKAVTSELEPERQELLRRLNQSAGATAELVAMRVDLLGFLAENPDLKRTDMDFVHLLRSWFNRGFLVLRQISWETPASILDKIVEYEAVHAINDWDDLRRRLYPQDRRCFAFFHPTMPDEPLIFVEVALTRSIPGSIQTVLAEDREQRSSEEVSTAVFYSISNCQKGLKGISFGNLLIKQVVEELSQQLPQLDTFVTLSPIPGFNRWLNQQDNNPRAEKILNGLADPTEIEQMSAFYLTRARNARDQIVDPVARFHLGNGALVHAVHANADMTENGLKQSSGAMVNYLYDLKMTETNHEKFVLSNEIAASRSVRTKAAAEGNTPKEAAVQ